MKRIYGIILFCMAAYGHLRSQNNFDCSNAMQICKSFSHNFDIRSCDSTNLDLWYTFEATEAFEFSFYINFDLSGYTFYGPFNDSGEDNCGDLASNIFESSTTDITGVAGSVQVGSLTTCPPGVYYLVIYPMECAGSVVNNDNQFDCNENTACENCIGSFAPQEGKKYLLSAWVREENADLDKLSFTSPEISLEFPGGTPSSAGPYTASGLIIDGWQRIEEEFTVPAGANTLNIHLICATGNCLFDDIRVLPYEGSMKSYVYDPVTLRLVAELDERHYTTFYEYDEEGKLVRIKKETEKGIMTIQESKTSVPKN